MAAVRLRIGVCEGRTPLCRFATSPPAERGERGTGAASPPVARAEGELSHGDGLLVDMSLVEGAEWGARWSL